MSIIATRLWQPQTAHARRRTRTISGWDEASHLHVAEIILTMYRFHRGNPEDVNQ